MSDKTGYIVEEEAMDNHDEGNVFIEGVTTRDKNVYTSQAEAEKVAQKWRVSNLREILISGLNGYFQYLDMEYCEEVYQDALSKEEQARFKELFWESDPDNDFESDFSRGNLKAPEVWTEEAERLGIWVLKSVLPHVSVAEITIKDKVDG